MSNDTNVWPALRRLVERVSAKLDAEEIGAAELKDLSTTLANVAKVEIQSTLAHRPPGRPPADAGSPFSSESEDLEEEPSDG